MQDQYKKQVQYKQLRFEYSHRFTQLLEEFSKAHLTDDRKIFKLNWKYWKEENKHIYEEEIQQIKQAGYEGCPHEKIFESVRYYYRKKHLTQKNNQNKQTKIKQKKQKLIGLSKSIKQSMDKHMKLVILERKIDLSPASTYNDFCKNNINELTREIYRLKKITNTILDPIAIDLKFKKAYKNRFYNFLQTIQ